MKATKNIRSFQACVTLSIAMSFGLPGISEGGEICPTNSSGPDICVSFDGDTPEFDTDFTVDYMTDPANPSVALRTGSTTWNIRTDDGGYPGPIGAITIDPSSPSEIFEVTIMNGAVPGVTNVGTIDLTADDWSGHSSIKNAIILRLTEGLKLKQDSGGAGGVLMRLAVILDVTGPVKVPVLWTFEIEGNLNANLTVTDRIDPPPTHSGLRVGKSVPQSVVVDIADIVAGSANFGQTGFSFDGTLILRNGISANGEVLFKGDVGSTALIDLNNKDVVGSLRCTRDNAGDIVNGGAVAGSVWLAFGAGHSFSGAATFASVSPSGTVETPESASLTGTLKTTGNMAGTTTIAADLASGARIWVVGITSGDLNVGGNVNGSIDLDDDLKSDVDIDGGIGSTGSVTVGGALIGVGRILVDGQCDGSISIGEKTDTLTLIHLLDGLGSGGSIEINALEGDFDADGDIHVGPAGIAIPDITFDGCIHIYDKMGTGEGGDLNGAISIRGCHDDDDLDVCVDGLDNGNVTITQTGCPNQVDWSCPDPPCP